MEKYAEVRFYLMFLVILLTCVEVSSQKPKVQKIKSIELRINSRDQSIVKRSNFHLRKDARYYQMNRLKSGAQHKRNHKSLLMKNKNSKKWQAKKKNKNLMLQRQRVVRNRNRR